MKHYEELKEMLCKELDKLADKGEITPATLEYIHKLTDTVKNLDKIEMLEGDGYSHMDDEYSQRRRYSRDGGWEARGNYGGNSYDDGGNSYRGRNRDSMGRYSRADGKEQMTHQLREMMHNAESEREKQALRQCISDLENA